MEGGKGGNQNQRSKRGPKTRGNQSRGERDSFPWVNAQIISASETGTTNQLLTTIAALLSQMNLVNLSTALHRLAKVTSNDSHAQGELRRHPTLDQLLVAICDVLGSIDASEAQPQSLSNIAWSLATIRLVKRPLVQVLASLAVTNMASFKPFELSTMLWALTKIGGVDESAAWAAKPVFQAAAAHIVKNVQTFAFRCLATTVWAFATAKQRHARLFRCIAAQMMPLVHSANCQELANTVWAFGTADFHDDHLFAEVAEQSLLRLEQFKAQEISNILWGFATNGFFHEAFFAHASVIVQGMELEAQHLANILWAFARVRPRHPLTQVTVLALLPNCTAQLNSFKPQEVSSTALAVAKAFGHCDELERISNVPGAARTPPPGGVMQQPPQALAFLRAVVPWALGRLHEFSAQSLANTVIAFVMLQMDYDSSLLPAIGDAVLRRYNTLEPTSMLHLLKGFAAVPHCPGSLQVVQALSAGLGHNVEELRPQELQALWRICSGLLGTPCGTTPEEIRGHCMALAAGEGMSGNQARLSNEVEDNPATSMAAISASTMAGTNMGGWNGGTHGASLGGCSVGSMPPAPVLPVQRFQLPPHSGPPVRRQTPSMAASEDGGQSVSGMLDRATTADISPFFQALDAAGTGFLDRPFREVASLLKVDGVPLVDAINAHQSSHVPRRVELDAGVNAPVSRLLSLDAAFRMPQGGGYHQDYPILQNQTRPAWNLSAALLQNPEAFIPGPDSGSDSQNFSSPHSGEARDAYTMPSVTDLRLDSCGHGHIPELGSDPSLVGAPLRDGSYIGGSADMHWVPSRTHMDPSAHQFRVERFPTAGTDYAGHGMAGQPAPFYTGVCCGGNMGNMGNSMAYPVSAPGTAAGAQFHGYGSMPMAQQGVA
mmetsp:Transcript_67861/g.147775  ORF Transcript_67861/g.147775 Transcript_67861/m.147775 type:complete len:887 (-) Transcript_67861:75-2735(-)